MNQNVLGSMMMRLQKAVNRRTSRVRLCLTFLQHELLRCFLFLHYKIFFNLDSSYPPLLLKLLQHYCFFFLILCTIIGAG